MPFKISKQKRYMLESFVLALLYTSIPVLLLFVLQTLRQLNPAGLVAWLITTLFWTGIMTYLYVKKISRRGGILFRE